MRHLTITYNDVTIFDGEVNEFTWSDSDGGIVVKGGVKRVAPAGGGLGGLLGAMAGARRQQTENLAAAKQLELDAPPDPEEE